MSSRDKRSENKTAKPEDFMDEEDKQASGEIDFGLSSILMAGHACYFIVLIVSFPLFI